MTLREIEAAPSPSVAASSGSLPPPSPTLAKSLVRFTADEYQQMVQAGILEEGAPIELLNGLIVWKDRRDSEEEDLMVHGSTHATAVSLLVFLAMRINSAKRHLRVQLPIHVAAGSDPEPDGAVVRGTPRDYLGRAPICGDVLCLIEISVSSLERDREDKLAMYASGGIAQYIIVNLRTNQIEVHTEPQPPTGTYRVHTLVEKGQTLRLDLGKGEFLEVAAEELLP